MLPLPSWVRMVVWLEPNWPTPAICVAVVADTFLADGRKAVAATLLGDRRVAAAILVDPDTVFQAVLGPAGRVRPAVLLDAHVVRHGGDGGGNTDKSGERD